MRVAVQARLLLLLFLSIITAHSAEPRIALIIGNSRYETAVGPLRNTVNDGKAMAKTLRTLGFTVIEEYNVTRDELMKAVIKFRTKLPGASVGLFYFAGHGISVAGANYLLPVKSGYSPESVTDSGLRLLAETKLFNAEQVVAEMSNSGAACNLVILDACRTTPIARNPAARDTTKTGLVEMNPPAGSLIAFATDAGHAASDGDGANGLYTEELITHLITPGLTVEQVFKRTRAAVLARSEGKQIPAEYSRLIGEDIFLAGEAPHIPKGQPIPVPTLAKLNKLAATGDTARCVEALRRFTRKNGPTATAPIATLLDHIKEQLRDPKNAEPALTACDLILDAIPESLPPAHPLTAKAHSRRGDALLALTRPEEALAAFQAALALTPDDAYLHYNRGRTYLALDRKEEARADFTKAAEAKPKQPGARKLALEALAGMK